MPVMTQETPLCPDDYHHSTPRPRLHILNLHPRDFYLAVSTGGSYCNGSRIYTNPHTLLPTVNLGEIVSGVTINNNNKSPVKCGSTDTAGVIRNNSTEIKNGMTDTRDVCACAVRTPSYREIVRRKTDINLSSSEGQALGKPSE